MEKSCLKILSGNNVKLRMLEAKNGKHFWCKHEKPPKNMDLTSYQILILMKVSCKHFNQQLHIWWLVILHGGGEYYWQVRVIPSNQRYFQNYIVDSDERLRKAIVLQDRRRPGTWTRAPVAVWRATACPVCAPAPLWPTRLQPSSQRWPPGLATATPSARPRPVGEWGRRADATHRRDEDVNGHGGETMGPSENRVLQKWRRLRRGSNVVGVWSGVGSVLSDLGFQLLAGGATLDWSWCGRNSSQQVLLANQSPF